MWRGSTSSQEGLGQFTTVRRIVPSIIRSCGTNSVRRIVPSIIRLHGINSVRRLLTHSNVPSLSDPQTATDMEGGTSERQCGKLYKVVQYR